MSVREPISEDKVMQGDRHKGSVLVHMDKTLGPTGS